MTRREFTYDDMLHHATEAFGVLGARIVPRWQRYNETYFGGMLKPVPLIVTSTQPFGKSVAFCSYDGSAGSGGRTITVNCPRQHRILWADNNTLLHEMVHQCLFERGDDPHHKNTPWCREIMRLHKLITGQDIWAGRSKSARDKANRDEDGKAPVIRINEPSPDGRKSLEQPQISHWPHSCEDFDSGIRLGGLRADDATMPPPIFVAVEECRV